MSLTASQVHEIKKAPPVQGVMPIFHERWSPRSFSDREVAPETLAKVFEAARWAASSANEQPWRFIVGARGSETFNKIYESLAGLNREWAGNAAYLILGVAKTHFGNGRPNPYALYDLGAAASDLTLQAAALGLSTHQIGGFDHQAVRLALDVPEEFTPGAVIALGYRDEPEKLANPALIERELAARSRKPLSEIVFAEWGQPAL